MLEQQHRIAMMTPYFKLPKRPSEYDNDVRAAAVQKMMPRFAEYCNESNQSEIEYIASQLIEAMDLAFSLDGFKIAYELSHRFSWEGDEDLVELCSDLGMEVSRQREAAVERWVIENNLTPSLAIGAAVLLHNSAPGPGGDWPTDGWLPGDVTHVDSKHAKYTVFVEALGHVRNGIGTHGRIVGWESDDIREPREILCSKCSHRHVDSGEWATKPHRRHLCEACGEIFAVASHNTTGIEA